ncbi:MAG: hypothetical protein ABIG84_08100 [archaeon]
MPTSWFALGREENICYIAKIDTNNYTELEDIPIYPFIESAIRDTCGSDNPPCCLNAVIGTDMTIEGIKKSVNTEGNDTDIENIIPSKNISEILFYDKAQLEVIKKKYFNGNGSKNSRYNDLQEAGIYRSNEVIVESLSKPYLADITGNNTPLVTVNTPSDHYKKDNKYPGLEIICVKTSKSQQKS